jgi:hypothetical protein
MSTITETFAQPGTFEAMRAAEAWCAQRGISVGSCERGSPRGLLYGEITIAKWRNLNRRERAELHGEMTGDMRNGPVHVSICEPDDEAPATAKGDQP